MIDTMFPLNLEIIAFACFLMIFSVELYGDTNTDIAINNDYHFDTIYLFNVYTFVQIDVTPSKEDESELDKYQ